MARIKKFFADLESWKLGSEVKNTLLAAVLIGASVIVGISAIASAVFAYKTWQEAHEVNRKIPIPNPAIVSGARRLGLNSAEPYRNKITAAPGDTVGVEIIVRNTTGRTMGLSVDVDLPEGLTLAEDACRGYDSQNPDGAAIAAESLLNWKNLGTYCLYNAETGQGESIVYFEVHIPEYEGSRAGQEKEFKIDTMLAGYNKDGQTVTDTVYQYVTIAVNREGN